jgi:hypothetical protein
VAGSHGKEVKSSGIRSNDRYPLWPVRFFNDIKQPSVAFLSSINPLFLVPARISFGWIEVPKVLKHRASITKIKTNDVSLIQSESGLDETDIISNDTCASSERRSTLHPISQIQRSTRVISTTAYRLYLRSLIVQVAALFAAPPGSSLKSLPLYIDPVSFVDASFAPVLPWPCHDRPICDAQQHSVCKRPQSTV